MLLFGSRQALGLALHPYGAKEPLISCDSGMQGKASRSETRGLSER